MKLTSILKQKKHTIKYGTHSVVKQCVKTLKTVHQISDKNLSNNLYKTIHNAKADSQAITDTKKAQADKLFLFSPPSFLVQGHLRRQAQIQASVKSFVP